MTLRQAIEWLRPYSGWIAAGFAAPPVLAFLFARLHGRDGGARSPWKYLYSVLVYAVSFPGMCSAILTAYVLFFQKGNLLDVNFVIYVVPVVSMALTLILVRKNVPFDAVPGFDRISGLLTTIGVTFVLVLAIYKAGILLVFFGSIPMMIALVVGLFALLKWGTYMLFRRRDEPRTEAPKFPSA
jgi:hypothetical protein